MISVEVTDVESGGGGVFKTDGYSNVVESFLLEINDVAFAESDGCDEIRIGKAGVVEFFNFHSAESISERDEEIFSSFGGKIGKVDTGLEHFYYWGFYFWMF